MDRRDSFDTLAVGATWRSTGRTLTEGDLLQACMSSGDWHPIHADEAYARGTPLGRRIFQGSYGLHVATGVVEQGDAQQQLERSRHAEAGLQWQQGRWQALDTSEPALHLSFHEAEAWCRWAGRRLPTEPEWECAAQRGAGIPDDGRGQLYGDAGGSGLVDVENKVAGVVGNVVGDAIEEMLGKRNN